MTKKVVAITGTGHCGSTLLDVLIGGHSRAFSLGEFHTIGRLLADAEERPEICVLCGQDCAFWGHKVSLPLLRLFYQQNTLLLKIRSRVARLFYNPYRPLFKASGKEILVDSSKGMGWLNRQFRPAWNSTGIDRHLIWVCRDGRAVVNSYYRKYPERGGEQITNSWLKRIEHIQAAYDEFPGKKMKLSYEALTCYPEKVMREVCEFLEIDYEPTMLRYWEHDHHHLYGNAGTNRAIIDYRRRVAEQAESGGEDVDPEWSAKHDDYYDTSYYEEQGLAIKFDERWKRELPDDVRAIFERLAGAANAPFEFTEVPGEA